MTLPLACFIASVATGAGPVEATAPDPERARVAHLDSGLAAIASRASRAGGRCEVVVMVRAGWSTAPVGDEDLATTVAEAVLRTPVGDTNESVWSRGRRAGAAVTVEVGPQLAVFRIRGLGESRPRLLELARELLAVSALDEEAVATGARLAAERRLRENDDAWLQATLLLHDTLWVPRPEPTPSAAGAPGALSFHRERYAAPNVAVGVWSDAAPRDVLDEMLRVLAEVKDGSRAAPEGLSIAASPPAIRCLVMRTARPPIVLAGQAWPAIDPPARVDAQVLSTILGGSLSSRLHRRLRVERQAVYTVESACVSSGATGLTLRIAAQTEEVEAVQRELVAALGELADAGIDQGELDAARAVVRSRLLIDAERPDGQIIASGRSVLLGEPVVEADDALRRLDELTVDRLCASAERFATRPTVTVVASHRVEPVCRQSGRAVP